MGSRASSCHHLSRRGGRGTRCCQRSVKLARVVCGQGSLAGGATCWARRGDVQAHGRHWMLLWGSGRAPEQQLADIPRDGDPQ